MKFLSCLLAAMTVVTSTGCVMKRTVTDGGQVVSENYYVDRPVRDAIRGENQKDSRRFPPRTRLADGPPSGIIRDKPPLHFPRRRAHYEP
jgi:hypothetical protein